MLTILTLAPIQKIKYNQWLKQGLFGCVGGLGLYLITILYAQQQMGLALLFLVVFSGGLYVFISQRAYSLRYAFPAVAGITCFIIFPLLYTVGISLTNYSGNNLLTLDKVQDYFIQQRYIDESQRYSFKVFKQGSQLQIALTDLFSQQQWLSNNIELDGQPKTVSIHTAQSLPAQSSLAIKDIIKLKKSLKQLTLELPNGALLSMTGLRQFAASKSLYQLAENDLLINNQTGEQLSPNWHTGFYENNQGEAYPPGFTVSIGLDNYTSVLFDDSVREPFIQIFVWTFVFSLLSVLFTFIVGLFLASLLQWDQVKGKGFYRVMLILPYAVPAFISILVFKGLFNQNAGEINLILFQLLGIKLDWFTSPFLAKSMILLVNTWLGYPYMMLLCMGLLQSIPKDLYEASAMDGAGPLDNLFKITLPMIIKPLTPLLIACFAFNFNNFVLISLLTNGGPDIIGATTPAGTTDLLVSYTYRIAFQDSGQNFGLAAAIATLIFLLVGALALAKLKLSKLEG
ncbi:maltose ABC transporter permease MalF [Spartinivicinus poritis]|uniref:Maltose/maltodextrin transport system permease protein n=1 Tax=Spartinivicinus poritis TaxID=2994640 RepID=A0ABT5UH48_9GAMM|nr:maltose ABC transporter permease MalF [Spartinivicinus sp. A2-2]MDE1465632.1 maltose ABC transporter permease MalF [Spartinivicinus sp. A2-2]